jgi:hypothetical protein
MRRRVHVAVLAASMLYVGALVGCGGDEKPTGISPQDAAKLVALENKGIAALERFDYGDAVGPLREASALAPTWIAGRYNYALALIHAGRDDSTEAAKILDDILALEPMHPYANFMGAWLAERAGPSTQDKALKLYEEAWKATRRDPMVGAKYGGMLFRMDGREKDAAKILEECHAKRPALIPPLYQLQQLYQRLDDDAKAKDYLARFIALNGPARAGFDRSSVGQKMQDAYGGMGPYSMAIREFDVPGGAPEIPDAAVTASAPAAVTPWKAGGLPEGVPFVGCAVLDFDQDGRLDVFVCGGTGPSALLRNEGGGKFADVAGKAGCAVVGAYAVCAGEFDVDPKPAPDAKACRRARIDLVLMKSDGLVFLKNGGDGTFSDATKDSGLAADIGGGRALLPVDADQEGDLDLLVSAGWGAKNRLWANKGPGQFEEIAEAAGLAGDFKAYGPAAALDFDSDEDLDLLVTRPDLPPALFANDRAMKFRAVETPDTLTVAQYGVAAWGDRVVLAGDRGATWVRAAGAGLAGAVADGAPGGPCVALDPRGCGRQDLVFADGTRLPASLGGGMSPFDAPQKLFDPVPGANLVALDADEDGLAEILLVAPNASPQIVRLDCPQRGASVVLDFEGVIKNDVQAGWSNLEGRGALVEVKAGARTQKFRLGNPSGFGCGSPTRVVAGLATAKQADYVRVLWPDAVQQAAMDVPAGAPQCVVEEQRRPDSCPLLFSWDGERYCFVTDFLGVGGIGFLVAPGVYGAPDPTESVKVDASLVKPRADGRLSFRVVEAMEEVCWLDAADLLVVDHPADATVAPDERFAGEPPFPNGDLVAWRGEISPVAARDQSGADVTERVLAVDRRWPDSFKHHPRLVGATSEQALELDFGDRLADVAPGAPLVLVADGWIEYGYTRTTVAAAGERFAFTGPSLEAWSASEKAWKSLAPNMGYPAGFPRTMTFDVTGKVSRETPRLRIRTTYEVYWDKVRLVRREDAGKTTRSTTLPAVSADLRFVGYPREVKPDGRDPPVYDYGTIDRTASWKTMEGDYTRFGDVLPLLTKSDDMSVVFGKGEEIELLFDAAALPALPAGWTRSYVVRFDGWCKGQEMYTAFGATVDPPPFHGMSNYPYPASEKAPDDEAHRRYRAEWNTRKIRVGR